MTPATNEWQNYEKGTDKNISDDENTIYVCGSLLVGLANSRVACELSK
jgi:hypothetical protein